MNKTWGYIAAKVFSIALLAISYSFAVLPCTGTVYFKKPDNWISAYTAASGLPSKLTASTTYPGWMEISATDIGQKNEAKTFYIEVSGQNDCQSGLCATKKSINKVSQQPTAESFSCSDFSDDGELWIMAHPDPEKENAVLITKTKPNIKYFYVFTPSTAEWMRSVPMITTDGGKTSEALKVVEDRCGWYVKRFINEELPTNVLIFRDDDPELEEAIGLNGDWESASDPTPIDLAMMFDFLGSDELYFVMTEEYAEITQSETMGWLTTDPVDVSANCSYSLAALIYDTDASLHPLFSCSNGPSPGNGCMDHPNSSTYDQNVSGCVGVHAGIVQDILGDDGLPKLGTSTNAKTCFPSEELFNQLFTYTPGVNEMSCFDMPFSRSSDGKWEFNSDYYTSPGTPVPGGFYPAEENTDAIVLAANANQTPVAAARTKRLAEGPVPMVPAARVIDAKEGAPKMDLVCRGPGWSGGGDCEGLYASGGDNSALFGIAGDPWLWGGAPTDFPSNWNFYVQDTETPTDVKQNPRWKSDPGVKGQEGRNQHFCFASHAEFTYKPGLKFSFRGDDDIWVFVDSKLAVDLGGTHLAAPGYVDLDSFKGKSGSWVKGKSYPIDIFFCDRRTTMSNVRIKTNMYIQQTSGLMKVPKSKVGGVEEYQLKFTKSGDGSCGSMGGEKVETYVGPELCEYLAKKGETIEYSLVTRKGDVIKAADEMSQSTVYYGGIDLTDRCNPQINKNDLRDLTPNTYILLASVEGKKEKFQFKITGNLDIATKPGVALDADGNQLPGSYEIVSQALASTADNPSRIPLYISSLMDQGNSLLFDVSSAVGESYSLSVLDATGASSGDVTLEYKDSTGAFVPWVGNSARTIGDGGVDTIYASIQMSFLKQEQQSYTVSIAGRSSGAKITFFAPKIVFVADSSSTTQITGDPSNEERWTGSVYNFYILALAPSTTNVGSYEPCGERCNFMLDVGVMTSQGIQVDSIGRQLVNGRATISIFCIKEYRAAGNGEAANPATLSLIGPNKLIAADYSPLYFRNPPVPTPVFADMFDVRGKKSSVDMQIDAPYFSMEQEYLDGIPDSLVIYYNREFYKSPDSLPNRIVVMWEGEADSVVVMRESFQDNMACGAEYGLADTLCLGRIIVKGVDFSKDVKTASPNATLQSFATFMDRNHIVEEKFPSNINDRIAPIIKSASVYAVSDEWNKMTIELSEEVQASQDYLKKAFTVFLNSAVNLSGSDKFVVALESPSEMGVGGDKVTIQFPSSSDKGLSPHTGDYVRFRADAPIWTDMATPVLGTDPTLRPADDAGYNWNAPTDYNSTVRLPSPWAPVTGEAETGVKSKVYTKVSPDTVPTSVTTVKAYPVTEDYSVVENDNPGVLGYFLMSDIYSLVYSDTSISNYFTNPDHKAELEDIYLEYEMDVFTNLGAFVAHDSKKIRCTDAEIFGEGHNCLDTQRNFFISWNTIASDGRLVGTGAFVSKIKSSVHLGEKGTRAKMDKTKMWGVRRSKGVINQ